MCANKLIIGPLSLWHETAEKITAKKLRTEIKNQSAQKSQSKSYAHKGRPEEKFMYVQKKHKKYCHPKT